MKTYLRHRIHNAIDVKELLALEYLDFEGKYKNYTEAHDFWELCYAEQGTVTLTLRGQSCNLSNGQLILIPPNEEHTYYSATGNRCQTFVVCFECFSHALASVSGTVFSADSIPFDCMHQIIEESKATFYMDQDDHLASLSASRFGGQQVLMLLLSYLLIHLVRQCSAAQDSNVIFFSEEHFYADLVNVVIRYLRENAHKKLTLDDVCRKFNYSRSFMCKIFKEQTGSTLITYLNQLKITEAKRLLLETSRTVTEISAALGFREVKYFDALFKKHTGLSPIAFRTQKYAEEKKGAMPPDHSGLSGRQ